MQCIVYVFYWTAVNNMVLKIAVWFLMWSCLAAIIILNKRLNRILSARSEHFSWLNPHVLYRCQQQLDLLFNILFDIKGPSRRKRWWREMMAADDSTINQKSRLKGAGLGSDMKLQSSRADLLLMVWLCATLHPSPLLCKCQTHIVASTTCWLYW